ncbi:MAG: FAD-dependent thymidylate synthase [Syntrophomonadaceae bacterium]|nr:FAD-dependent thymidylate synthase [Syntrophomonadaceae bacterium]
MIIQNPQVLLPQSELDPRVISKLERYARVCYKSEGQMTEQGDPDFLKRIIKSGHESIIEHEKITLMFIIDRGISHEIVRHRAGAAYSQESTRYCNYSKDKFSNEISVIDPYFFRDDPQAYKLWMDSCQTAESSYMNLLKAGRSPQEARSVLPNSLKTEIVVSYNMREWRHFLRLRCDKAAHPQMRQVGIPILLLFREKIPVLFADVEYDSNFSVEHYAPIIMTDDNFIPLK